MIQLFLRLGIVFAVAIFSVGCNDSSTGDDTTQNGGTGDDTTQNGGTSDTTAPTVSAISIEDGAIDVALDSTITVTFSEAVDESTLTAATVTLTDQDDADVTFTTSYSDKVLTLTPDSDLGYNETYTLTLTTGITDLAGNALASGSTTSFTTASTPPLAGGNGYIQTYPTDDEYSAKSVAIQSDGKIIVTGDNNVRLLLARFDADGLADTTHFGTNGVTIDDLFSSAQPVTSLAIQDDGKIVVGGWESSGSDSCFYLARYLTDGTLDTSFDSDGIVRTCNDADPASNSDMKLYDLVIQPDGKILAVGSGGTNGFHKLLVRYNTDGSIDTDFGTNGFVTGSSFKIVRGVALQSDGKIIIVAKSSDNLMVSRYNADGTPDTDFGTNGELDTTIDTWGQDRYPVLVQDDGKIVVAGHAKSGGGGYDYVIARITAAGALDTGFGTSGVTKITQEDYADDDDQFRGIAQQDDGKIVAIGTRYTPTRVIGLVRFDTDGSVDTTFGTEGFVDQAFEDHADGYDVAIQGDGKIIVVGKVRNLGGVLLRYNPDGTLDQ